MVQSRIVRAGDTFAAEINGKTYPLYGYMSYHPEFADYPVFREMGVPLLFVPVFAGDRGINPTSGLRPFRPGFWKGPEEFDFSAPDAAYRCAVGNAKPGEVWVIPRLMLEPPSFWEAANPDELCRDYTGMSVHQSMSSKVWLADTIRVMERFQAWLEESGWDAYTAGWHIAAGSTEEFIRIRTYAGQMTDYSRPAVAAWRVFLRDKYGTAEALNAAWGTSYPDFDGILPPTPAQRTLTPDGAGQRIPMAADWYRFHSAENAHALCALAHAAKRITGGRIVGSFYGYGGFGAAEIGLAAADIVQACPDVDFFANPFVYPRPEIADWPATSAMDSAALDGKAWFMECDVRTHLSRSIKDCLPESNPIGNSRYEAPVWYGPKTEERSLNQMKKAFAKCLTGGRALWWFDMWGGWYRTPAYQALIRRGLEVYRQEVLEGTLRSGAQTALFTDAEISTYSTKAPHSGLLQALASSGAAFRQFTLRDLPRVDAAGYRAAVIGSAQALNAAQLAALDAWRREGRSLIFIGDCSPEGPAPDFVQPLESGCAEVFADFQQYRFDAAPAPAVLRDALLAGGVHIWAFTGDAVCAGDRIVAIHALTAGEKRLYAPEKAWLEDIFTGERLYNTDFYTDFRMYAGETRVFRIHPGVRLEATSRT